MKVDTQFLDKNFIKTSLAKENNSQNEVNSFSETLVKFVANVNNVPTTC
jgi:hypothetical protein